jgi:hypothetical protein
LAGGRVGIAETIDSVDPIQLVSCESLPDPECEGIFHPGLRGIGGTPAASLIGLDRSAT